MSKRIAFILATLLAFCLVAGAQSRRPAAEPKEPANKESAEKPLDLKVTEGLMGVSQNEKDWYFDIPDAMLGRRIKKKKRCLPATKKRGVSHR